MPKEYTTEQLWKLYQKLPKELQEAIFSGETSDNIWGICEMNEIPEEKMSNIAKYVGDVLLGILPPDEFQAILEKEVKLTKEVAKKVTHEINRFVFSPVKESLAALYQIEIVPPAGPPPIASPPIRKPEVPPEAVPPTGVVPPMEKKPPAPSSDTYRETIE